MSLCNFVALYGPLSDLLPSCSKESPSNICNLSISDQRRALRPPYYPANRYPDHHAFLQHDSFRLLSRSPSWATPDHANIAEVPIQPNQTVLHRHLRRSDDACITEIDSSIVANPDGSSEIHRPGLLVCYLHQYTEYYIYINHVIVNSVQTDDSTDDPVIPDTRRSNTTTAY